MALTVSDVGNGVSTTNNTTLATGATVTASIGDVLVLMIAASNDGTSGAARTISSITDNAASSTNVYSQRGSTVNYTAGTAGDGASAIIYECPVTTALSNNTITITLSGNTAQKAVQVYRVQPGSGERVQFQEAKAGAATGATLTHGSVNSWALPLNAVVFCMAAIETDDTITGDTDTTGGSWSTILSRLADAGVDANTMTCSSQYKILTSATTQNWACTTAATRDSAGAGVAYIPVFGLYGSSSASASVSAFTGITIAINDQMDATSSVSAFTALLNGLPSISSAISTFDAYLDFGASTVNLDAAISTIASLSSFAGSVISNSSFISSVSSVLAFSGLLISRSSEIAAISAVNAFVGLLTGASSAVATTSTLNSFAGLSMAANSEIAAAASVQATISVLFGASSAISASASIATSLGLILGASSSITAISSVNADLSFVLYLEAAIAATAAMSGMPTYLFAATSSIPVQSAVSAFTGLVQTTYSNIQASTTGEAYTGLIQGSHVNMSGQSIVTAMPEYLFGLYSSISALLTVASYIDFDKTVALSADIASSSALSAFAGLNMGAASYFEDIVAVDFFLQLNMQVASGITAIATLNGWMALGSTFVDVGGSNLKSRRFLINYLSSNPEPGRARRMGPKRRLRREYGDRNDS